MGSEVGEDVVKVTFPHPEKWTNVKTEYNQEFSTQEATNAVVCSTKITFVPICGGSKDSDEVMFRRGNETMDAGATGFRFERNIWQHTRRDICWSPIFVTSISSEQG